MTNDGRHYVGYILEDGDDRYWKVKLTKNYILTLKNPRFDSYKVTYRYHNNNGSTGCVIKYYWLIRILIHTSGHGKFTLNMLAHRMKNDSIIIVHSS